MGSEESAPEQLPRGRHNLSAETVARSQRRRLLRGVVEVVAERGYADARIADVIKVAGISRKTYYELFEDKEACFLAAYELWVGRMLAASASAFGRQPGVPWPDRLREGLRGLLQFVADNPKTARFCIVEALAAGPEALDARDSAVRSFAELLEPAPAERSSSAPGITALALVGGVNELLYGEIRRGAAERVPRLLPDLTHWVVRAYLGDERAAEERDRARMPVRALALQ